MTSFIADQLLVPEHWHRTSQILCLWLLFVSGGGFWPEVVSFPLLIDHADGGQIRSGAYVAKSPNKYPRLFVDNHLGRCVAMAQHENFLSVIPESKLAAFKGRESRLVSSGLLDPQPMSRVKNFDSKVVVGVCTNLGCVPTQTLEPLTTTFTDP
uniref:(northern house mosquito) hypothetical protein n=1 Tax=Culex pipiens TaxID=7175 RepID=A0A8D8EXR8_CULPI